MRKAPPKSHLYTIVALLTVLGVIGGLIIWNTPAKKGNNETVTSSNNQTTTLTVSEPGELSQLTNQPNALNPQSNSAPLQSASGVSVYENFDGMQPAAEPSN